MSKLTGVLVLEGPDGAGKTTLAEALVERYDAHYVHRTWHKGIDVWDHHLEALIIANERSHEQLVIIDRLHLSEQIYGRIYRGVAQQTHNVRCFDRVLLKLAAINVMCVPRDLLYVHEVHARKHAAGQELYTTVDAVAKRYVELLDGNIFTGDGPGDYAEQQSRLGGLLWLRPEDTYHYDVTKQGHDLKRVGDELEAQLRKRQADQFTFSRDPAVPNCLGHRREAQYLFVGEQVGDLHSWSRWPFFARTHSPDFLNKALHELAFPENYGVWTNAWDEVNALPRIYAEKPALKVIALGRKAERRCAQLRIPVHAAVPHPSWARRFNHHGERGKSYKQQLDEALR